MPCVPVNGSEVKQLFLFHTRVKFQLEVGLPRVFVLFFLQHCYFIYFIFF